MNLNLCRFAVLLTLLNSVDKPILTGLYSLYFSINTWLVMLVIDFSLNRFTFLTYNREFVEAAHKAAIDMNDYLHVR